MRPINKIVLPCEQGTIIAKPFYDKQQNHDGITVSMVMPDGTDCTLMKVISNSNGIGYEATIPEKLCNGELVIQEKAEAKKQAVNVVSLPPELIIQDDIIICNGISYIKEAEQTANELVENKSSNENIAIPEAKNNITSDWQHEPDSTSGTRLTNAFAAAYEKLEHASHMKHVKETQNDADPIVVAPHSIPSVVINEDKQDNADQPGTVDSADEIIDIAPILAQSEEPAGEYNENEVVDAMPSNEYEDNAGDLDKHLLHEKEQEESTPIIEEHVEEIAKDNPEQENDNLTDIDTDAIIEQLMGSTSESELLDKEREELEQEENAIISDNKDNHRPAYLSVTTKDIDSMMSDIEDISGFTEDYDELSKLNAELDAEDDDLVDYDDIENMF